MIEEHEASHTYSELHAALRENSLEWLADDIDKQVSLGKEITKEIQVETTLRSDQSEEPRKKKGPHAKFVASLPYTPQEKLRLLVDAVGAASIGLSRGLQDTQETIFKNNQNIESIGFAPDVEGIEMREVKRDDAPSEAALSRLERLLKEIREQL